MNLKVFALLVLIVLVSMNHSSAFRPTHMHIQHARHDNGTSSEEDKFFHNESNHSHIQQVSTSTRIVTKIRKDEEFLP